MRKECANRFRILLGATLGSLYSLIVFLPEMGVLFNILSRIAAGGIIVFASFGFKTLKRFLKLSLTFILMTFLFAGAMIAMWIIFRPSGMVINNSTVYFGIKMPVLIASTALTYIAIKFVMKFLNKSRPPMTICDVTLYFAGKDVKGRAMLDTGNTLSEGFSGYPVVVCTYEFVKDILPYECEDFFKGNVNALHSIADKNLMKKVRVVSYGTVSETGLLPAFQPDKLVVGKEVETDKVFVGVLNCKKYINESFDMLLNPNLF